MGSMMAPSPAARPHARVARLTPRDFLFAGPVARAYYQPQELGKKPPLARIDDSTRDFLDAMKAAIAEEKEMCIEKYAGLQAYNETTQ